MVEQLLGRPPRFPYTVATRCPDGTPQVLQAEPIHWEDNQWKPFPTYLWLVCPRLRLAIAHLEQDTFIKKFSQRLKIDNDFRTLFLNGQEAMAKNRVENAKIRAAGSLPMHVIEILKTTTIAGSRLFSGVKCLHAHVAQELVFANNPIGREVLSMIGRCASGSPCDTETKGKGTL